jgi:hypothetical protein
MDEVIVFRVYGMLSLSSVFLYNAKQVAVWVLQDDEIPRAF